jgi:ABC-type polar amino acid transport system ATPase subunit
MTTVDSMESVARRPEQASGQQPLIELRGISKRFGDRVVLDEVDFSLQEKEMVVVMGRSGSGKSTMLRVVAGLTTADAGRVLIGGEDVMVDGRFTSQWPAQRRRVGMIFQQYTLWPHMNVLENLALGPRRVLKDQKAEIRARAEAVLDEVGMASHIRSRPNQLSGGERQRVAIARALMMRPQVLLCDEITSALDPPVASEVLGLLTKLRDTEGIACVIVTHDMAFAAKAAERLLFFDNGAVVDEGSPATAFSTPKSEGFAEFIAATTWTGR